jgi:signal transduction histidine kinase
MRSLTWKLGIAFLIVSITGAVVAAIFVHFATQNSFQTVVNDRAEYDFATTAAICYQNNSNSWSNVSACLQQAQMQGPQGNFDANGEQPAPPFILTDAQGKVLVSGQTHHAGDTVSTSQGKGIILNGQVIGYVLPDGTPPLTPSESAFLSSTQQALILGALAAFLVALAIGIVLARTMTRPVRELTTALQAMTQGELQQVVPVRSQDELGQLSVAFNRMSTDLAFANQQRRQMTADIAHDLRTPVTVIAGYLEALRDGVLPPTPERFAILYEEAQHLQGLIEDLRTLSLTDAGELTLHPQPIAPQALLQRIAAIYLHQAEQQAVTLRVQASDDLPPLNVDVDRMVQVLSNLVSNALRYTPQGGTISLGAKRGSQGILLAVRDTGEGIMPDALPKVFDRFYRADSARAQAQGESGLGLAIAKALVEAHGGTISVASQPGQGATFTIRLPVGGNM